VRTSGPTLIIYRGSLGSGAPPCAPVDGGSRAVPPRHE